MTHNTQQQPYDVLPEIRPRPAAAPPAAPRPAVAPAPHKVAPAVVAEIHKAMKAGQDEPSLPDRIRALWTVLSLVAEEGIRAAEEYRTLATGDARRGYVVKEVVRVTKSLETKYDLLPAPVERVVFASAGIVLHWMVDRIHARLAREGEINLHKQGDK